MNGSSLAPRCPRVRGKQKGGSRNVNTMTKRYDGQAHEVLGTREENMSLSGFMECATEEVTLEWHVGRFRSHQVNRSHKEGKGIPGRWNSMCKGAERHKCDVCRSPQK